jgi:hypothetical protein
VKRATRIAAQENSRDYDSPAVVHVHSLLQAPAGRSRRSRLLRFEIRFGSYLMRSTGIVKPAVFTTPWRCVCSHTR